MKGQKIFELVEKRAWTEVVEQVKQDPNVAQSILSNGGSDSLLLSGTSQGNLVLHEACKSQPTTDVVEALLEAFPSAASTKGQWGYLPLHYASSSGASKEVVQILMKAYHAGTRARDDYDGVFPIHLACKWGAPYDVLLAIMVNYPEGIYVRDNIGKTPNDHADALTSSEAKDAVLRGLSMGPMLCAVSRAAQLRTKDETESKIRGMAEAHTAHMRRWEERRQREKDEQREVVDQLKNDLSTVSCKFTAFQNEIEGLAGEKESLETSKTTLEEVLSSEREQHETKIRDLFEKMEVVRKDFSGQLLAKDKSIEALEKANEKKDSEIAALKESLKVCEEEKSTWKRSTEIEKGLTQRLKGDIEELSVFPRLVKERDEAIKNFEMQIEVHEKAEHTLATNAVLLQKARNEAQHDLRVALAERDSIRQRRDEAQIELGETKKKIHAYKDRLSALQGWVRSLDSDMNAWSVEDAVVVSPVGSVYEEKKDDGIVTFEKRRPESPRHRRGKEASPPTYEVIVKQGTSQQETDVDAVVKDVLKQVAAGVKEHPHDER